MEGGGEGEAGDGLKVEFGAEGDSQGNCGEKEEDDGGARGRSGKFGG